MIFKFKNVHIYRNQANSLDFDTMVLELQKYFPEISFDIRNYFLNTIDNALAESLVSIRIFDTKKPFSEQPQVKIHGISPQDIDYEKNFKQQIFKDIGCGNESNENKYLKLILYDGFMIQRLFETMINESEANSDHVHVVFEDRLISTFSEEDYRYHARSIVVGSPSIISTTGIVESPAKPKEWYLNQMRAEIYRITGNDKPHDWMSLSIQKENYLCYGDYRINFVAVGYVLQALFFFITVGNPFCKDVNCRLYNAHWQEDLIHSQIQSKQLCKEHADLLSKFKA